LSNLRSNSPVTSWYYGQEVTQDYNTGGANDGTLTTASTINLVDNTEAVLTFYEWSEVESSPSFDRTRVQISTDGVTWDTVFESHGTNDLWEKRQVDLTPYVGENISLRFWFDSIDNFLNSFEGWYVDDVQIVTVSIVIPNAPPIAINDSFVVSENSLNNVFDVLQNDTDADNDPLTVDSIDTTGTLGTVTNNVNDVTYTPLAGFTGVDSFTYIATDGEDPSDSATVSIDVTEVVIPPIATITDYEALNILSDGSEDSACTSGVTFSSGGQAVPLIDADAATCTGDKPKEDKLKSIVASTDETDLITFYLNNDGYLADTQITGQATGNDINFKSKSTSGTLHIKLVEVDPDNGSVITVLDTQDESANANQKLTISDISSLQGTVSAGNSFGIQLTWEADSASNSQLEMKWGKYGQATKRILINVGISQ